MLRRSPQKRSEIEKALNDFVSSLDSNIFVGSISHLPDYYKNYSSQDDYNRLIKNISEDLQYETFDDYKSAGKYIDKNKLKHLKETVEDFCKTIFKKEKSIEDKCNKSPNSRNKTCNTEDK